MSQAVKKPDENGVQQSTYMLQDKDSEDATKIVLNPQEEEEGNRGFSFGYVMRRVKLEALSSALYKSGANTPIGKFSSICVQDKKRKKRVFPFRNTFAELWKHIRVMRSKKKKMDRDKLQGISNPPLLINNTVSLPLLSSTWQS